MFGNKDVNNVYKYTAKGNLVAVITNGTVLGLEILVRLQKLWKVKLC
jgi:hypothetical protein